MRKTYKVLFTRGNKPVFIFLQKLFLFYWVTSLLGHYIEVLWSDILHITIGAKIWHTTIVTATPLAPPYGLGILAVILLTLPLMKRYKLHPLGVFILNIFVTGVIEYLCALILVIFTGHIYYWNYLDQPFNVNGYVCLKSAVLFSIAATLFIYFIYPLMNDLFDKIKKKQFNLVFWVVFISYSIDLIALLIYK